MEQIDTLDECTNEETLRARLRAAENENNDLQDALYKQKELTRNLCTRLLGAKPPAFERGVYFLLSEDDHLLYVGQSDNVLKRMVGHGDKCANRVLMVSVSPNEDIIRVEQRFIKALDPFFNIRGRA